MTSKRSRITRRTLWALALAGAASAYAFKDDVAVRHGPHGIEAVRLADAEFTLVDTFDDGPHVRYVEGGIEAHWICAGKPVVRRIKVAAWPVTLAPECAYPHPLQIHAGAAVDGDDTVLGVRKLAAFSDPHGQYELLMQLLAANGVVDADSNWRFGDGQLVVTGDVFDRGHRVTEIFWLLYSLEQQAREAGGRVHFLLGNHEYMVLRGDLRYLNGKYPRAARLLGRDYPDLYGNDSVIGRWLRGKRTLLRIDDALFVHGGIAPDFATAGIDLAELNARYRASIGIDPISDAALADLHDDASPIWYRGYFHGAGLVETELDAIMQRFGVRQIVVGHTSLPAVAPWHQGRVISIDSSIKKGVRGELLFREDGTWRRGTLAGERLPLTPLE
jgi:hypothetical protein